MYRKNSFFVVSFVFRLFFSHVFLFEENKYSLFLLFQKLLIIVVSTQKHNFEMKRKHCSYGKILAGIAGMIFLSGCSKMETQSEDLPIRISASLNVYTRATDNSFEQGDVLGLYLVKWTSGTPGILQGTGNYGDNLSVFSDLFGLADQHHGEISPRRRKTGLLRIPPLCIVIGSRWRRL